MDNDNIEYPILVPELIEIYCTTRFKKELYTNKQVFWEKYDTSLKIIDECIEKGEIMPTFDSYPKMFGILDRIWGIE